METFKINGTKFEPGYYTWEQFGNSKGETIMTHWLVYSKAFAKKNPRVVNTCGVMLEYFETLPENANIFK